MINIYDTGQQQKSRNIWRYSTGSPVVQKKIHTRLYGGGIDGGFQMVGKLGRTPISTHMEIKNVTGLIEKS